MPLEPIEEKDLDIASKFGTEVEAGGLTPHPQNQAEANREKAPEIISAEKEQVYQKILSKVQTQNNSPVPMEGIANDAKEAAAQMDADGQVKHLVELAAQKGVVHAVKVAQHLESNYILDSFHDKLLSEELHKALLGKGLIQEL
jgi:hypothetical protein